MGMGGTCRFQCSSSTCQSLDGHNHVNNHTCTWHVTNQAISQQCAAHRRPCSTSNAMLHVDAALCRPLLCVDDDVTTSPPRRRPQHQTGGDTLLCLLLTIYTASAAVCALSPSSSSQSITHTSSCYALEYVASQIAPILIDHHRANRRLVSHSE